MANPLSVKSARSLERSPAGRPQLEDDLREHLAAALFPEDEKVQSRFQALLETHHWLGNYIAKLVSAYHRSGDVDFSTAERLLLAEKEQFERDLAVARRMLRMYGDQLPG